MNCPGRETWCGMAGGANTSTLWELLVAWSGGVLVTIHTRGYFKEQHRVLYDFPWLQSHHLLRTIQLQGLRLKFLRDGMDSANLVAMYSVAGQDSWNFFKNNFSNHIPKPPLSTFFLGIKFSKASNHVQQVGLSDLALYGEDGVLVSAPKFPYRLNFRPTGKFQFSDSYVHPVTHDLATIPTGSTLYQVWALDQPSQLGGQERHIADLVLVSDIITSMWGDTSLFFRHQDMAEDLEIHPEWREFLDTFALDLGGCPVQRSLEQAAQSQEQCNG